MMDHSAHTEATGLSPSEMAAGLAGLEPPPLVEVPTAAAPAEVRWLTDKKRIESYDLAFPFAIGDVEYRTILVKRLSAGEVAAFIEKMKGRPAGEDVRFPMFFVGDAEMSVEAWQAMDDDDRFHLTEISADFLPARFRP